MHLERLNFDWSPKRPFRAVVVTFSVLSLLLCVTTPFMDDVRNRLLFLLAGFAYSAALAFFAVGFCLLPSRVRARTLKGLVLLSLFPVCLLFAIAFALRSQAPLSSLNHLVPVAFWVSVGGTILFLGLASYGWYLRLHDSSKVP